MLSCPRYGSAWPTGGRFPCCEEHICGDPLVRRWDSPEGHERLPHGMGEALFRLPFQGGKRGKAPVHQREGNSAAARSGRRAPGRRPSGRENDRLAANLAACAAAHQRALSVGSVEGLQPGGDLPATARWWWGAGRRLATEVLDVRSLGCYTAKRSHMLRCCPN